MTSENDLEDAFLQVEQKRPLQISTALGRCKDSKEPSRPANLEQRLGMSINATWQRS